MDLIPLLWGLQWHSCPLALLFRFVEFLAAIISAMSIATMVQLRTIEGGKTTDYMLYIQASFFDDEGYS